MVQILDILATYEALYELDLLQILARVRMHNGSVTLGSDGDFPKQAFCAGNHEAGRMRSIY